MANRYGRNDSSVVVVIGSGAGGGTVANELAQKGIDVVCLEAGSRMALADIVNNPGVMNRGKRSVFRRDSGRCNGSFLQSSEGLGAHRLSRFI